jgi:glycerol-3-phosphate dehydrogenase (NAD(P)+)
MKKICMLGSGAFGTAIATVLAHNGHDVTLWCKESEVATEINQLHTNTTFLPGVTLSKKIIATTNLADAVAQADYMFIAVPVQFIRSVLEQAKQSIKLDATVVLLSKGIEQTTLVMPLEIAETVFGAHIKTAVLAGPSFAQEVAKQSLTGLVIASFQDSVINDITELIQNNFIKLEKSYDVIGVQLCGAIKNVIALGAGIVEGAGYGSNTKALFLVRCMTELRQILLSLQSFAQVERLLSFPGDLPDTFEGLAGIGDIVLTAYCAESRNVRVGKLIGAGQSLQAILDSVSFVPEGINTAAALEQMIEHKGITLPILANINTLIEGKITVKQWINFI